MQYHGIHTIDIWRNGGWYTEFHLKGEIVKTVEWNGKFNSDDVKRIIDNEIVKFI